MATSMSIEAHRSIDDITISMKGDRTVQIVADLWDEGGEFEHELWFAGLMPDHAQWNVLLGEDVNKAAISATFKGFELRVTGECCIWLFAHPRSL